MTTEQRRRKLQDDLIDAAESAIAAGGLSALHARDLARAVGCALGAIYNVVPDLHALVFHVNSRTLAMIEGEVASSDRLEVAPGARLIRFRSSSHDALARAVRSPPPRGADNTGLASGGTSAAIHEHREAAAHDCPRRRRRDLHAARPLTVLGGPWDRQPRPRGETRSASTRRPAPTDRDGRRRGRPRSCGRALGAVGPGRLTAGVVTTTGLSSLRSS